MFARIGKWLLVATVGVLAVGLVGLGIVHAQGPNPERTPRAGCPLAPQGGGMGWRWGGGMLQTWAEALGMTPEELAAAMQDGKSVADLAAEKGLELKDLVDKALAAREAVVREAVEAGRLTQEQADALRQQMQERMSERLQSGACAPGAGRARWGAEGEAPAQRGYGGGFGRQMRRGHLSPLRSP